MEFVFNCGQKAVDNAILVTWEMAGAQAAIERKKLKQLEVLNQEMNGPCVEGCDGSQEEQAGDILRHILSDRVLNLLREGRGKFCNILLICN